MGKTLFKNTERRVTSLEKRHYLFPQSSFNSGRVPPKAISRQVWNPRRSMRTGYVQTSINLHTTQLSGNLPFDAISKTATISMVMMRFACLLSNNIFVNSAAILVV